jgi:ABC-type Mn2+/Zn2+ transport system ATPase subunit
MEEIMKVLRSILYFLTKLTNNVLVYSVFLAISVALENRDHFKTLVLLIIGTGCLKYVSSIYLIFLYNSEISFARDRLLYESRTKFFFEKADSKNIYNKINAIIENIFCKEELSAAIFSIFIMLFIYYYILGTQSIIIFIIAAITIPIVFVLKHYSEKFFTHLAEYTEQRNILINNILKSRYSLVGSASLFKNTIEKLLEIVKDEKKWRSLDSGIKTLETYLSLFYKYIPYLVGLLALRLAPIDMAIDPKLYWMSIPAFATFFSLPRLFLSLKENENGFNYLTSNRIITQGTTSKIIFTGKDYIWRASLRCNVPYMGTYGIYVLKFLNIWQELRLEDVKEPINFFIDPDKLSEGQKKRLLLARAICLAKHSGSELIIECEFKTLDKLNKKRVYRLFEEIVNNKVIKLSYERHLCKSTNKASANEISYECDNNHDLKASPPTAKKYNYGIDNLGFIVPFFILFFFVAGFDCYIASIVSTKQFSKNDGFLIFFISIASFFIAIFTGILLENSIRASCFNSILNSISSPFVEKERINQSVSIDLDICLEAFSFYLHDFLWVASLFFVTLLAMVFLMGVSGLFLSICFSIFIAFLYVIGYRKVVEYRDQFIYRAKLFANVCENMLLADKVWSSILERNLYSQVKNEIISVDTAKWFEAKCNLYNAKTLLSSKMQFGSSLAIASVVYIYGNTTGNIAAAALVLAALLSVESESLRFFIALSGVMSTKNSALSILNLNNETSAASLQVNYLENGLIVSDYISKRTGIHYKEFIYTVGLNLVCGVSGAGKTTYFIDILKTLFAQSSQATFLTRAFFEEQMHKLGSFDKTVEYFFADSVLNDGHARLIIFDEVTHLVPDQALRKVLSKLSNLSQKKKIILMVSDHRVSQHDNCHVFNVGG